MSTLDLEKKEAKRAARDLCYGEDVIRRIELAKTPLEIDRILKQARTGGKQK